MADILTGELVDQDMNAIVGDLKGLGNRFCNGLDQRFFLFGRPSRYHMDVYGRHDSLLFKGISRVMRLRAF